MATERGYSRNTHQSTARQRPWAFGHPPRRPPIRRSVVPWEKDFYESLGVPWPKVDTGPDVAINAAILDPKILDWDDSGAVKELLASKKRYWAKINGGIKVDGAASELPDPDMYIDVIVDDSVDPELDAEYEAARRARGHANSGPGISSVARG